MSDSSKPLLWQREGSIDGVRHQQLASCEDQRGWLCELWRTDELPFGQAQRPNMAYVSMTNPGVLRGPHEHRAQTDIFVFNGAFEVFLWDAREASKTYGVKQKVPTLVDKYTQVVVPPGVIHGYRNTNPVRQGLCFNFPNQLYKGWNKASPIDEIRHEDQGESQYVPW